MRTNTWTDTWRGVARKIVRARRGVVKIKESWLARQDRRTRAGFQKLVVGRYNGESNAHNQLEDLYTSVSRCNLTATS
jgi:hypothetical protein